MMLLSQYHAPTLSTFEKEEALNKVEIQKQIVEDKIIDEQIKLEEKTASD
ncbi:MAG: hypothetical protein U5K55_02695 [Aliarcobacter sp.]|nr:hypothetical protein [Aliarcobacter sp.]